MDSPRFDAITRRLDQAGSRRMLVQLGAGLFAPLLGRLGSSDKVAAGCGICPTGKPCCINGTCRPKCGDTCCPDCFVEVLLVGEPDPADAICCKATGGTVCEHRKPGKGDDRCCYEDEICVKGKCCGAGIMGVRKCDGKCCPQSACCNGTKCCKNGHVCATKTEGDPQESCVPANRDCTDDQGCFPGETCRGGKCCSGNRICQDLETDDDVCCKAGEYCDFADTPNARCIPVNTSDSTFRGHRVRT